ncbi:DUF2927 domain-containing protein [Ekhidna sp.]|uniref:DUF2927 domain-containing protein n=1 Tax=Ekhidna sp. TaxID=2608089 RepID=UPI003B58DB64
MKKVILFVSVLSLLTFSCSKEDEIVLPDSELTDYGLDVINYFKEVALGFEFGEASKITRRWNNDMKIYVGGNPTSELLSELDIIVKDINGLTASGFSVEIVNDSVQSNFYIHFGSGASYSEIFPSQSNLIDSNWGLFTIFWNGSSELYTGYMYVDIFRANSIEQKHLLREELTQSLGLARDSFLYSESIFQQAFSTKVIEYSKIDKDLIRLLYHPKMSVGLSANQVDGVLRNILLEE